MNSLSSPLLCLALCAAVSAARAAEPAPGFDLLEIQVEGNTVLPVPAIEAAIEPHLGPGRGMAGVEAARTALEAAYQKAGYLTVLVDIPEQRVDGGLVRLQVLEGKVGRLYVMGSRYHDQGWIRNRVTELQPGTVPDFNRVQTQLAQVNRGDEQRVQPVIRPGRLPGTVDVELQVEDRLPVSGTLELNNQHSASTDSLRLQASLRYDNLFQAGHGLQLNLVTAPLEPQQSRVWVANYTVPDGDASWTVSLTRSNSDVATLGGTQVLGNGTTLGVRHAQTFGRDRSALLSWGADLKLLRERTVFGSDALSTPLHYLPFQLAYSDQLGDGDWRWQWNASLTAALGALLQRDVDCPLANGQTVPQDQFLCKRKGGDGSFLVGRAGLSGQWRLGEGSLAWRLNGQVAARALVSAEQFAIGGADTVRGYLESEATGDHGLAGSLEWRLANLASPLTPGLRELVPLMFLDAGRVHTTDAAAGQAIGQTLAGAGLGLRISGDETAAVDGALELAWPLRDGSNARQGDLHVHARVQTRF